MSPRVFKQGELIFWFHNYDTLYEDRASVHVGKGSQHDSADDKIWLEPNVEVARSGRILPNIEFRNAYEISRNRKMIIWDPEKCAINDQLCIDDYLSAKSKLQR